MSKLIVEMEMPQNCFECNFHCVGQFCDGMGYCSAVPPYCDDDCRPCEEKRPDWCPIKGVLPEQHGDLIDRDVYLKLLESYKESKRGVCENKEFVVALQAISKQIKCVKAVIAAERANDGNC